MNVHNGEYKQTKGMEKLKEYIIDNVMNNDYCLVIGSDDMMKQFSKDCKVPIDRVMADLLDIDGNIIAEPMRIFNKESGEILLLGMANKTKLINVVTFGMTKNVDKAKDLVIVELKKEKLNGGYKFLADSRIAYTQEEKIEMISSLFRRPDIETMKKMETSKKLMKGEFILEMAKSEDKTAAALKPMENRDNITSEKLSNALGIDDDRDQELIDLTIKFFGKALGVEKLSMAKEISNMSHDIFLSLLEEDKGTNNIEKLYIAFNQGMILQEFADQYDEKFEHLEKDNNENIKQVGKKYACEIRKSDTIIKIGHLGISLKEKLKACFWSGYYNREFYKSSE
jgi:hypothetical protein